jgi:hypothetical protein
MREATGEEGAEPGRSGPGPAGPAHSGVGSVPPFALSVRLFIASAAVGRHIEQIVLLMPITRKPPPQDEGES